MSHTAQPNARTTDADLRSQFALILEQYPDTHATFMATFPGWIEAIDPHDADNESRTAYKERRRAAEKANAELIAAQDAWLVANAEDFEDAIADSVTRQTAKGKKKDTAAPRPKPTQARKPPPTERPQTPSESSSDDVPLRQPPPIKKNQPSRRPHLVKNKPPSPLRRTPPRKKRARADTVTDEQRASKRPSMESLSTAPPSMPSALTLTSLLKAAGIPPATPSSTPAVSPTKSVQPAPKKTKAKEKASTEEELRRIAKEEREAAEKAEADERSSKRGDLQTIPCTNCHKLLTPCYRMQGKPGLTCSRCRVRKIKCEELSTAGDEVLSVRETRPKRQKPAKGKGKAKKVKKSNKDEAWSSSDADSAIVLEPIRDTAMEISDSIRLATLTIGYLAGLVDREKVEPWMNDLADHYAAWRAADEVEHARRKERQRPARNPSPPPPEQSTERPAAPEPSQPVAGPSNTRHDSDLEMYGAPVDQGAAPVDNDAEGELEAGHGVQQGEDMDQGSD